VNGLWKKPPGKIGVLQGENLKSLNVYQRLARPEGREGMREHHIYAAEKHLCSRPSELEYFTFAERIWLLRLWATALYEGREEEAEVEVGGEFCT
jgi:hypothetical protein